jgi:glycosyltransferase involved in cell wall biosynthesis
MNPLISVIIPIYKVEPYIRQCVDSVLAQDYAPLEVILVDDGSPDNCGSICDGYAQRDGRVRAIHKENGGLSDARNAGVASATGDFIIFLDGDDLWEDAHALSRLMQRQGETGADVLNYSYVRWYEDTDQKHPYFVNVPDMPRRKTKAEQMQYLTEQGLYIASACNKLIRRSLGSEIPFRKGVYSEDIEWCARLMLSAGSMDFVNENFYLYRQRSTSIRHTINRKKCENLTDNILSCFALDETADPDVREAMLRYTAFQYGTFVVVQAQAEHPPLDCIEKLRPYSWILNHHGHSKKILCLKIGCNLLGNKRLCRLVRFAYSFRGK